MPRSLRGLFRRFLHRRGYGIAPYPLTRLLSMCPVEVVLDVGANAGQFGQELRRVGYEGRIISFEPLPEAYRKLAQAARRDRRWRALNLALGAEEGSLPIHVASNLASSSLLRPNATLAEAAPSLTFQSDHEVPVRRLDSLFDTLVDGGERAFLKVDTQGFEQAILRGAGASLGRLSAIQLELSLTPLYEGEPPAEEVIGWLRTRGFEPAWLYPAFWEPKTRRWLQADVVFLPSGRPLCGR